MSPGLIPEPGYASLFLVILFFGSAILVAQGIVGSYVRRAFESTKKRPLRIISRVIPDSLPMSASEAIPVCFVHERGLCESRSVGAGTRIWAFAHVLPGARIRLDATSVTTSSSRTT